MHYINSSCICLYTAGDDVLCKFTLTLRPPQVLRKHKVPLTQVSLNLKKTTMVSWAGCKVNLGGDPESTRPPLLRRGTRNTIPPEDLNRCLRVSRDFRALPSPLFCSLTLKTRLKNAANANCSVTLSVLNIWAASQPTLLSASLSLRHLGRRGLEALGGPTVWKAYE